MNVRRSLFILISTTILSFTQSSHCAERNELSVLSGWDCWSDAPSFLSQHFNQQAFKHLQAREEAIAQLKTERDWRFRQQQVKQLLNHILGPFPERTPLHPQITGVVQKDGYRVEKIIFQSMPNFYVTGCLFIPDKRQEKTPAILNPIGHTGIAFRSPLYQQVILNLVKKGFIVFAFDPLGQGERLQYYDPVLKKSTVGGSTAEHSHFGRQCFLNGISSARYFVWDGIRAIDYLLTRDEVDPERIAVTGLSGGGTQTAYISAMDDRVAVAAPTCYITSFKRLLESIGPQDAEQDFVRGIAMGLDHADFIEVRAPKPTLILATTRDFFSIQGTRETYKEAKQAFSAFGKVKNLQIAEDDYTHGYTRKTREALYAFLQKHLAFPGDPSDEEIQPLTQEELTVTETGQILTSLEGKRVFDYNLLDTQRNRTNLKKKRGNPARHLRTVKREAPPISGYQKPPTRIRSIFTGGVQEENYRIEKYVLDSEGPCIIPLLLLIPKTDGPHPSVIYLHPEGKYRAYFENRFIEKLVKRNYLVAVPDLSGIGETGDSLSGIKVPFTGVLIGRSLPGFHAGEIVRIANFVRSLDLSDDRKTIAIARSHLGPALLHAAAFDSSLTHIALVDSVISYQSIAANMTYQIPGWCHSTGALSVYDLPDLAACTAPKPLLFVAPSDAAMKPVSEETFCEEYRIAFQVNNNILIHSGLHNESEKQALLFEWIKDME